MFSVATRSISFAGVCEVVLCSHAVPSLTWLRGTLRGAALNYLQKMGGSSPEEKWQELVEEMEKRGRKMQVGASRGVLSFHQRSLLSQPSPSLDTGEGRWFRRDVYILEGGPTATTCSLVSSSLV